MAGDEQGGDRPIAVQVSVADRSIISTSHAETVVETPQGLQDAISAAAASHNQGDVRPLAAFKQAGVHGGTGVADMFACRR